MNGAGLIAPNGAALHSPQIGLHGLGCAGCIPRGGLFTAGNAGRVRAASKAPAAAKKKQSRASGAGSRPQRIDVHHHIIPPRYLVALGQERLGAAAAASVWQRISAWTPERSIEEMDRAGVATSVTSVSAPGVWFGDAAEGRRIARECNEYAAKMARDYPGRFGSFAALPLPDTDGSLREIEYAFDELRADGVVLMTSYRNQWPGHASFAPVFEELNRRKAVVFFHPTAAPCCTNLIEDVPDAQVEFLFDTVRAVMSLLYSGSLSRYPDIRFIFAHGGSAVPLFAGRIARLAQANPKLAARLPHGPMHELRKLHFELTQVQGAGALAPLLDIASPEHLMLGSDFPWGSTSIDDPVAAIRTVGFTRAQIAGIERGNALRLMPGLGGVQDAQRVRRRLPT